MSYANDIEEIGLDDPLMRLASGGEVGATGMADDYHYTGYESVEKCIYAEMTGRGGFQKGFLASLFTCLF
jgi:hypothetical protein